MDVRDAGCGVPDHVSGEAVAAGDGWLWLLSDFHPVHLTGPTGVRGPLTARCAANPQGGVGTAITVSVAVERSAGGTGARAGATSDEAFLAVTLTPVTGRDPADLAAVSMQQAINSHGGRGSGLTPEGDDVLMGLVAARAAVGDAEAAAEAGLLSDWATGSAGEPSRALLSHAARGELIEPAHDALAALLRADAAALERATPALLAWGASSGRALLAGLAAGVWGREP